MICKKKNTTRQRFLERLRISKKKTQSRTQTTKIVTTTGNEDSKSHRKQICKNVIQLLLLALYLACTVTAAGLVYFNVPVNKRGFFCDDMEIMSVSMQEETVSTFAACLTAFIILTVSILGTDSINFFQYRKVKLTAESVPVRRHVMILQLFWTIKSYLVPFIALATALLIVAIGKKVVGALRPDFLEVCFGGQMGYETFCETLAFVTGALTLKKPGQPPAFPTYVDYDVCYLSSDDLDDLRMSFPSGHTALAMTPAFYSIFYINYHLRNSIARYASIAWQLVIIIVSWYISVSRIGDNKHHYSDVASSVVISLVVSVILFFFLQHTKRNEYEITEQTKVETHVSPNTTTSQTVNYHAETSFQKHQNFVVTQ